jgi:hypothetical protein
MQSTIVKLNEKYAGRGTLFAYLDDVVVVGESEADALALMEEYRTAIYALGLCLNDTKTQFLNFVGKCGSAKLLGGFVGEDGEVESLLNGKVEKKSELIVGRIGVLKGVESLQILARCVSFRFVYLASTHVPSPFTVNGFCISFPTS